MKIRLTRDVRRALLVFSLYAANDQSAHAYEFATHASLSREAFALSSLGTLPAVLAKRGLPEPTVRLGNIYVDMQEPAQIVRVAEPPPTAPFVASKIRLANTRLSETEVPLNLSAAYWLMHGSIREDDVPLDPYAFENTPQDEPGGNFARVLNHFFNPYSFVGLLGAKAPDWAIGTPSTSAKNHFDVAAAREAYWRTITLSRLNPGGSLTELVAPPEIQYLGVFGRERSREELSRAYSATLFRTLGSAVHLLQDMAQPQHTRSDPHAGLGCTPVGCALGHQSYYESYVEAVVGGKDNFTLRDRFFRGEAAEITVPVQAPEPQYGPYPIPRLADFREYFYTTTGGASPSGSGLANYSNQGFYSIGTNLGGDASLFPSPPAASSALTAVVIPSGAVRNANGDIVKDGSLTILTGPVRDSNSPADSQAAVRLSSFSAFDSFLAPRGKKAYSLNHYNYADQAALLLPRAVAYGAGFLDYFFRGDLDISVPAKGAYGVADLGNCATLCGFKKISLRITNRSPRESLSAGTILAVVRLNRNTSFSPDLAYQPGSPSFTGFGQRSLYQEIIVSDPISLSSSGGPILPGGVRELDFNFSTGIPAGATDVVLQVAFRGSFGQEADAVIVGSKDISEPTFFGFANITDYVWDDPTKQFAVVPTAHYKTTDDTLNLKLRFGSATNPVVATLPKLSAKQHAQIAVLSDRTTQTVYVESQSANYNMVSPVAIDFPAAEFYTPVNTTTYDANMQVGLRRGVYRQNYLFWGLPVGNSSSFSCTPTDEHCLQATLPPLVPANAVAWNITF